MRGTDRAALLPAALALGLGLALAFGLRALLPAAEPWTFELGPTLARWLEAGDARTVTLTRPDVLWLMPVAVVPFLLVVLRQTLVDAPRPQIGVQLLARVAVLLAAALALAQPTLRSPIRGKSVVLVVDVSDSIDDAQLDAARALVEEALAHRDRERATEVPREDRTRLSVVTYAERAQVQVPGEDTTGAAVVERPEEATLGSDHGGALRVAAALVDPETEGRVVLVTDGGGSLSEREDLKAAAAELADRGITLHVRRFDPAARDDVLVEAVHLPAEMRLGETFEVAIDLLSTAPGEVTLRLDKDGAPNPLEPEQTVTLRGGPQQVVMKARVTGPGPVVFEARLDPATLPAAANRRTGNDRAAAVGEVRGRPKILLAGVGGDEHLEAALEADHLDVERVGPGGIPTTPEGMRAYDLVMFSDLPAAAVPVAARQALGDYVVEHGGGFVMIGGENSFGLGGWGQTSVESLLPVEFEGERQREQPKLALVLVIDKSGSMSSEDKLDLVKEAARATARTLDPTDELGVIAFDSRPHTLVRLQPASNRIRIAGDIRRLSAGGGTNALPALREAYLQLAGSNALVKHVILLSDGQSPENGIGALLGDMRDAEITVSAVGVGAGAGKDFLRRVASRGRGRFYYSHDGTDVPRIFSRETHEVTRNAVQERVFFPRVAKNVQALRGIDFSAAPGLRGIVPVQPKALSEVLLRTHAGDPLLVRGRRGLGRTAAFASDAKSRWAAPWLTWGGFAKLWSQVARDTMRQGATLLGGATIRIEPTADAGAHRVVVDVDAPEGFANDLAGEAEIVDPAASADRQRTTVPLRLAAPGRYEARIEDVHAGERLVRARLYDETQDPKRLAAEAVGRVAVPYPAELHPRTSQGGAATLEALATATATGDLATVLEAPGDPRGRERSKPLWPHVLFALFLPLLVVDLLLRRVSLGVRRVAT